jgi:hypothetical protein
MALPPRTSQAIAVPCQRSQANAVGTMDPGFSPGKLNGCVSKGFSPSITREAHRNESSMGFAPLNPSAGATALSTSKPAGNSEEPVRAASDLLRSSVDADGGAEGFADGAAENPRLGHLRDVMQDQELRSRAGHDRIDPALVVTELHE